MFGAYREVFFFCCCFGSSRAFLFFLILLLHVHHFFSWRVRNRSNEQIFIPYNEWIRLPVKMKRSSLGKSIKTKSGGNSIVLVYMIFLLKQFGFKQCLFFSRDKERNNSISYKCRNPLPSVSGKMSLLKNFKI